ncbi:MAG: hypothetical protein ACI90G_000952, partial [Urechidicola sp.]
RAVTFNENNIDIIAGEAVARSCGKILFESSNLTIKHIQH